MCFLPYKKIASVTQFDSKGHLGSVWISVQQLVGDDIWHCLCLSGVVVHDWSYCAVEFTNYGRPHWSIDNYRLFNYLSDFAENWLDGVFLCQNDTREILS